MNRIKKLVAVALSTVTVAGVGVVSGGITAGASGTGAGLAEHALNAYYEKWDYVWGGTEVGAVDCSGMIWMYCGGDRLEMLADAQANGRDWGYVSDGIPRVHGLGLSRPGHVGVYIEDGMEVDARGSDYGVCYQLIGENGWNNWDCWFKLTAVSYPDEGWENFNGNYYYYENGEYIVDTSRTIDGTTYYFDSKGHSSTTPSNTSSTSTSSGSSSSSSTKKSQPTMWQKGSKDDEVVKIQTRLAELGYYSGPIDGDFGDQTETAFKAFQKAAGLTVDGIAGEDREVLYSDNAPAAKQEEKTEEKTEEKETVEETTEAVTEPATEAVEETTAATETVGAEAAAETEETPAATEPVIIAQNGDFNDQVANIQVKLAELGYYDSDTAGVFGDITEEAVVNFQLANGLSATGKVDVKTFEVLFSDDVVAKALESVGADISDDAKVSSYLEDDVLVISIEEEPVSEVVEQEPVVEEVEDAVFVPIEESPAVIAAEPTQPTTISTPKKAATATAKTGSANSANAAAAKSAQSTVKAAEKAASATTPTAKTASVKPLENLWMWLLLAAAVLGVIAFILLMHSRKSMKRSASNSTLNERW